MGSHVLRRAKRGGLSITIVYHGYQSKEKGNKKEIKRLARGRVTFQEITTRSASKTARSSREKAARRAIHKDAPPRAQRQSR